MATNTTARPSVVAKPQAHWQQLYRELNNEQRQAVETIEGPVMVLAGPGTGKTHVLAMRVAQILQQTHMDPWNILCLTFTEAAVAEMRERLKSIIGRASYYVRIHTFHSFCNDVIRDHPQFFSLQSDRRVLTDLERVELLRALIDTLPGTSPLKSLGNPYHYVRDIVRTISQLKQEEVSPDTLATTLATIQQFVEALAEQVTLFCGLPVADRTEAACSTLAAAITSTAAEVSLAQAIVAPASEASDRWLTRQAEADQPRQASAARTAYKNDIKRWYDRLQREIPQQREVQELYTRYLQRLQEQNKFDFEDMILLVLRQWRAHPSLLAEYQEQFQYILTDEYQDTNSAQNDLLKLLGSFDAQPNIFVVGDDKQSIYRFQGASMHNMLDFYRTYPAVRVISLRQNYRSRPAIIAAADALILHNRESLQKYIPALLTEQEPVRRADERLPELYEFTSLEDEQAFVAHTTSELLVRGTRPEDIAVIFRYNRDGRGVLEAMRAAGVPARLEAGENVFEKPAIRQLLTLLTYLVEPHRDDLLAQVLHFPWWRFDPLDVLKVLHVTGRKRLPLLTVITEPKLLQEASVVHPQSFIAHARVLATWRQRSLQVPLMQFINELLTESGWFAATLSSAHNAETMAAITTFLSFLKQLNEHEHTLTMPDVLQRLVSLQEYDVPLFSEPWRETRPVVRLLTAHKAKGREFSHVFIVGCNDRHWGNKVVHNRLQLPRGFLQFDYGGDDSGNEEERRLMYVAMTRAKDVLMFTRSRHTESGRLVAPSIFWTEIPQAVALTLSPEQQSRILPKHRPGAVELNAPMTDWARSIVQSYILNVTHLNNYLACPRKFYARNLLKLPTVRTPAQAVGSAVHGALAAFLRQCAESKNVLPLDTLNELFTRFLALEVLAPAAQQQSLAVGLKILRAYYDEQASCFALPGLTEYSFATHGVRVQDIPLTGVLDRITILNDDSHEVRVTDFKTGDPVRGMRKAKPGGDYHRQLVFYQLLCDTSPQFPYTMVEGEIDFIQMSTRQPRHRRATTRISAAEKEDLITTISRVWQEIQNLNFLTGTQTPFCGKCEYCLPAVLSLPPT